MYWQAFAETLATDTIIGLLSTIAAVNLSEGRLVWPAVLTRISKVGYGRKLQRGEPFCFFICVFECLVVCVYCLFFLTVLLKVKAVWCGLGLYFGPRKSQLSFCFV